jgi:hypothetical protein
MKTYLLTVLPKPSKVSETTIVQRSDEAMAPIELHRTPR